MTALLLDKTTFLVTCASGWETRAKEELHRALRSAHARSLFLRGNLLMTCEESLDAAVAALAEADTECVGRIVPLQVQCEVSKDVSSPAALAAASDLLPGPVPEMSFKAVCDRRGAHDWTSGEACVAVGKHVELRTGSPADFESPQQVLSIEVFQDVAYLGVCRTDQLLRKSIRRMRRWAPGTRPLNRAELKLREVIDQFELELPAEGRALDIGASPGGWTKVLAEHLAEVVAVDPGELDPRVLELANVRHLSVRSEALLQIPDIGRFDIITNDMNMDPDKSADVLCELAELLKPGGIAVMTVKFVTVRRREHVQEALDRLGRCFADPRVARVPHNAMETTIVARKPAG